MRRWLHPKDAITPAWEFYEADPYAEWAVHHARLTGAEAMGDILVSDAGGVRINPGFSFGRRHPDRGCLRLRRARPEGATIGRQRTLPGLFPLAVHNNSWRAWPINRLTSSASPPTCSNWS